MSFEAIKTITGRILKERGEILTPQLHLCVEYTQGGQSLITGDIFRRGYIITVRHERVDQHGNRSMLIDGLGDATYYVELALRYNRSRHAELCEQVRCGRHDEVIAHLFEKAKKLRPQLEWQAPMLPITDRFDLTSNAALHAAVESAVSL